MGLLLPAVQSAREAGRRNTCSNNLSQLGKSIVAYDSKAGKLPGWKNPNVGTSLTAASRLTTSPMYSWPVMLLPGLERLDIYSAAETVSSGTSGAIVNANVSSISAFVCPSSPADTPETPSLAYVGNAGYFGDNGYTGNGVFFDRCVSPKTISLDFIGSGDGTSNTLLFAERNGALSDPAAWNANAAAVTAIGLRQGPDNGGRKLSDLPMFVLTGFSATGRVINGTQDIPIPALLNPSDTRTLYTGEMLSSNHAGGVSVVFCDGHTLFLRDSISPKVLSQLMTSKSGVALAGVYDTLSANLDILREADFK